MIRFNTDSSLRCVLLLIGACIAGCSASDAELHVESSRGSAAAVTHQPSTSLRDAQVQELGQIRTLPPDMYDEMLAEETHLQEHGIPSYQPIYVRGYFRAAYVEPETNKIAWRGMTCTHADCPGEGHQGGPFVFPDVHSALSVNANGQVVGHDSQSHVSCPACGRADAIERYTPPDAVRRRAELQVQLAEIRHGRDEARASGTAMPELTTTPREIMNEIANLPALYLVEE